MSAWPRYTFRCDRCKTEATDTSRERIQEFTEHHYRNVHPLFFGHDAAARFVRKPAPRVPRSEPSATRSRLLRTLDTLGTAGTNRLFTGAQP